MARRRRQQQQPTNSAIRQGNLLENCISHVVAEHGIPTDFSPEALEEADAAARDVPANAGEGRRDLTAMDLVTIDGADAKDFDDAVHCTRSGGEFILTVAIADVGHYVEEDSALDREAAERGNSAYFPGRVYPMLPPRLSEGICSLIPHRKRLALCCEARIGPDGKLRGHELFEGVIRSSERFTYDTVAEILAGRERHSLEPMLRNLDALCDVLLEDRISRGGLDIDLPETLPRIEQGYPVGFETRARLKSHRIIEECMLAANICAADFTKSRRLRSLYRVHPDLELRKVEQLRATLANRGINVVRKPTARDLIRAMRSAEQLGEMTARAFKMSVRQSLSKALYSPESAGHFGLAYENYTHFTSPIRRYPDLLVHRCIKRALRGRRPPAVQGLKETGEHCTQTEVRADRASWDLNGMLGRFFLSTRIGQMFDGVVTSVADFGIFVEIEPYHLDGFIHISELGRGYFEFDRTRHRLVSRRGGRAFAVGDPLRVELARVLPEENKTDFKLVGKI